MSNQRCPFCLRYAVETSFTATVLGKYTAEYADCRDCGSLHVVSPSWLSEAYADPARGDALDGWAGRRNEILAALAESIGSKLLSETWLDYGCGQGLLVKHLKARGIDVDGYDRFRGTHVVEPILREPYAVVMSFEVLEHQVDPLQFMLNLRRRMRDDGLLILSTCLREPHHGSDWDYLALAGGQHVSFASEPGLAQIAVWAGLNWWATGRCRESPQLQVHVFSDRASDQAILQAMNACGFDGVLR